MKKKEEKTIGQINAIIIACALMLLELEILSIYFPIWCD